MYDYFKSFKKSWSGSLKNMIRKITALPRFIKQVILVVSDSIFLIFAIFASFSLRLDYLYIPESFFSNKISWLIMSAPLIGIPIFAFFGLYRAIIRHAGYKAAWSILKAVSLYALIWGLLALMSGAYGFPRSVVLINFMVCLIGVGGSRIIARYFLLSIEKYTQRKNIAQIQFKRILIFGAGDAGRRIALGLIQDVEYEVLGFIDDNTSLQGQDSIGLPILSRSEAETIVNDKKISDILLAMPSISRIERNNILKSLLPLGVRIKTLPSNGNYSQKDDGFNQVEDLDIEDLLMRDPIVSSEEPLELITNNNVVLVTGAGGSIGGEICRQILSRKPKILLLFEVSEFALYEIQQELENISLNFNANKKLSALPRIIPLLGSVQDERRVSYILQTWSPDVIYHAAAYKHVPMVEGNLSEGIKNNVFGTLTMTKLAVEHKVKNFVLISTDKAVNPTNVMGASKRIAELILQAVSAEKSIIFDTKDNKQLSLKQKTNFCKVRFGNVLGSSGSVVPLFRKQISKGGPITVSYTHLTLPTNREV